MRKKKGIIMSKNKKTDQENKIQTSIPIDKSIADGLRTISDTLHLSFVSNNFLDYERNTVDGLYAVAGAIGEVAKAINKIAELEESKEDFFK
jgi:hypothetical protein